MQKLLSCLSLFLLHLGSINAQNSVQVPVPTSAQVKWQNAELAALVCWDLHVFDGEFYVQHEARIHLLLITILLIRKSTTWISG